MMLNNILTPTKNLLPHQGAVLYWGKIIENPTVYFETLRQEIDWENDQAKIFGKIIHTKRKVAWYGDQAYRYRYSNIDKVAHPWTDTLIELKAWVTRLTGETFNSCLLNLYHHGEEGMAWHSDGEKDLKKHGAIASLSFGAERKFSFKHKETKQRIDILLEDGSLLIMKEETQDHWLHRLPPTKRIETPRINLTFRTIDL
ncbi:MAG: alpha-ketoglutarate-dependent dioxygenase AlkB family protein [Sphingobacterium sp.]